MGDVSDDVDAIVASDALVKSLDASNIDAALISAWCSPRGWMITNEEVHAAIKRHPKRLYGVAAIDLRSPPGESLRIVEKLLATDDFVGVRYLAWLWDEPPTHRNLYPVLAYLEKHEKTLFLQVGHTGPLRTSEYGRPIPYVERIALDFPNLNIVCGHIGAPWERDMIFLTRKFKRVFIDLSAYTPKRYPKEIVDFLQTKAGSKKVFYGTNFPMIIHQKVQQELDLLHLNDSQMDEFMGNALARALKIETSPSKL